MANDITFYDVILRALAFGSTIGLVAAIFLIRIVGRDKKNLEKDYDALLDERKTAREEIKILVTKLARYEPVPRGMIYSIADDVEWWNDFEKSYHGAETPRPEEPVEVEEAVIRNTVVKQEAETVVASASETKEEAESEDFFDRDHLVKKIGDMQIVMQGVKQHVDKIWGDYQTAKGKAEASKKEADRAKKLHAELRDKTAEYFAERHRFQKKEEELKNFVLSGQGSGSEPGDEVT